MMLRVFLVASLLVVAFADHHEDDDHGCCSHEDRREIQHLWQSVWESSFTERKIRIAMAVFERSVTRLNQSITKSTCRCPLSGCSKAPRTSWRSQTDIFDQPSCELCTTNVLRSKVHDGSLFQTAAAEMQKLRGPYRLVFVLCSTRSR